MTFQWLFAFCYGYLVATLGESFFHQHIQHGFWRSWLFSHSSFSGFVDAKTSHELVHHNMTYKKNHVTQFTHDDERRQVSLSWSGVCAQRSFAA